MCMTKLKQNLKICQSELFIHKKTKTWITCRSPVNRIGRNSQGANEHNFNFSDVFSPPYSHNVSGVFPFFVNKSPAKAVQGKKKLSSHTKHAEAQSLEIRAVSRATECLQR